MARAIATRILSAFAILAVVSVVVFVGVSALPGETAQAVLGAQATPELKKQYREKYDLDRPLGEQYVDWISGMVHGDFGKSFAGGTPVSSIISSRLPDTLILAGITLLLLVPLAIGLGVFSAVKNNRPADHAVSVSTLTMMATPEFVIGTLLAALFAVALGWLPGASLIDPDRSIFSQLRYLVLPVMTLVLVAAAQATRMIRAMMIEVLQSEYVQMAYLKGVPRRRVLLHHALPNAAGPTLQIIAFTVAWLLGGIVTVELVFQFPGIGTALVDAVTNRDLPTVQAIVLIASAIYIFSVMLADIGALLLNPRLRRART